jgi:uncharacterized protein with PQ loop repeat
MAGLEAVSVLASVLGCLGYLPELYRVLRAANQQPTSHALWLVWWTSAVLNLSYALVSGAAPLIVVNYGAHAAMCTLCSICNARLACRASPL